MKIRVGFFAVLITANASFAQNDPAANLNMQFDKYQTGAAQEKLFVHTDKTFYLAGETIWFKIYSVDASYHKPFTASSIAYIEIINRDSKAVIQTKVTIQKGNGAGSLILPGFLPSGNYIFRAYTSWMKNFSSDFYYEQTLQIVNTVKLTAKAAVSKSYPVIQFFPEGGTELYDIETKIAFKATEMEGRGLDCHGSIVTQNNDTVTKFHSLFNGMGSFQLKPDKKYSYYAVCIFKDTVIKQQLTDAQEVGFSMNISENEKNILKVSVHATSAFNNTEIYLLTQTRQVLKNVQSGLVHDGSAVFTIDKKLLGNGISGITLFNSQHQPVCERLVFNQPTDSFVIDATTDQTEYNSRKKITVNLNAKGNGFRSSFSMAVLMIDSLQPVPDENIVSYLYLNSELKGKIESPDYYFIHPDSKTDEALNNLLLTQGWRRFKLPDVLENKKSYFEFLPEVEGPVVNGRIINKLTGAPVSNMDYYISVPGSDYAFNSATSDFQGFIRFGIKDIYKNNALVFQPAFPKDSNNRIDITSAYSDKPVSNTAAVLNLTGLQENILLNRSIANQVENTFNTEFKHKYINLNTDTTSFYGKPGRGYNLDDYTRFQTMEEVMREYVEDVRVRKEGNKFNFRVMNRTFGTYFEEQPLMLIDGIPVTDATKIINLNPLNVKRIEVVMHNYFIGSSEFQGIVNVKSYSGEMGNPLISPNALVVEYDGIQQQREFYSPVYESPTDRQNHIPDFRNVLYWNPEINFTGGGSSQVSFYSSDVTGKFVIIIQGISSNGIPGKTIRFFNVAGSD